MLEIPDMNSYNLYFGWYLGELEQNDSFFDAYHNTYPDRVIGLSEYGADAIRLTTVQIRNGAITQRNISVFTMSIWQKCWKNVHGSGPAMSGTCLISDVQPETKAA